MRRLATLAGVVAALSGTPARASYESECRSTLAKAWQDQIASHPIDGTKDVIVLLIDSPLGKTDRDYQRALDNLKRAFPSFEESPGSGILIGCCAIPVWGAISRDELDRLSVTNFAALCKVARRSRSTRASVRLEHRESYEAGQSHAYFVAFWEAPRG